jgi:hypothetical protein
MGKKKKCLPTEWEIDLDLLRRVGYSQ